jgi:hypothetical protein
MFHGVGAALGRQEAEFDALCEAAAPPALGLPARVFEQYLRRCERLPSAAPSHV